MKIGFLGAGGTGKTTLARALSEHTGLAQHQSTTRGVYAKYGKKHTDMPFLDPAMRKAIQLDNFNTKIAHDVAHPEGIFDRTLVDHLMYVTIYCHDTIPDAEFLQLKRATWKNICTYDILFYFPIYLWPTSVDDGFRESGAANRFLQDAVLRSYIELSTTEIYEGDRPNIFTMKNHSVGARLDFVLYTIGQHYPTESVSPKEQSISDNPQ